MASPITWNPVDKHADITLSNGDLDAVNTPASTWRSARGGALPTGNKSYFEIYAVTGASCMGGIADATHDLTTYLGNSTGATGGHGWAINLGDGNKLTNAVAAACLSAFVATDTQMVAFDPATGKVWFGRNGMFSGNPAAGTGEAFIVPTGVTYYPGMSSISATAGTLRVRGQAANQVYAAPAGFTPAGDSPSTPIAGTTSLALAATASPSYYASIAGSTSLTFGAAANPGSNMIAGATALTLGAGATPSARAQLVGATSLNFAPSAQISYPAQIAGSTSLSLSAGAAPSAPVAIAGATTLALAVQAVISSSRAVFFRQKWLDVYAARQTLLNKISDALKFKADAAQTSATNAANQAAAANAALADIASDNLLTPGEKPTVRLSYDTIISEQPGIDAQANNYLVVVEKNAYDAAVTALSNYLTGLTTPTLWSDISGNTTIVGSTFRTKFADVYATRQALLNKIVNASPVVSGDTLLLNADMEMPDSGWTKEPQWRWEAGTYVRDPGASSASALINQKTFAVSPGQVIRVTGLVTNIGGGANGATAIALYCYDAAGVFLGLPQGSAVTAGANVRSTGVITIPAGAAKAAVSFYTSGHTVGYWKVDSARCTFISESLDEVPDGIVYGRFGNEDGFMLAGKRRLGLRIAGSGHRIGDSRNMPQLASTSLRAKIPTAISYSAAAGTPATATISIAAFTALVGSVSLAYNAMSVGTTGTNGATVRYFLYFDDPAYGGGAQTLVATTDANLPYQNDGRVYAGSVDVVYPASGTSAGAGTEPALCVTVDMFLRPGVRASKARTGLVIDCLDLPTGDDLFERAMHSAEFGEAECVRIVTDGGAVLDCSVTTTFDLLDGRVALAPDMLGEYVVTDCGIETVTAVTAIGKRKVAHVHAGGISYAAGRDPAHRIYSHNVVKP